MKRNGPRRLLGFQPDAMVLIAGAEVLGLGGNVVEGEARGGGAASGLRRSGAYCVRGGTCSARPAAPPAPDQPAPGWRGKVAFCSLGTGPHLWLPGMTVIQPFSTVASSKATQALTAIWRDEPGPRR